MTYLGNKSLLLPRSRDWEAYGKQAKGMSYFSILNFGGDAVDTRGATGRVMLKTWQLLGVIRLDEMKQGELF
jgi:hypothetical protein